MKIRLDFVSNSSSTSFVVVGRFPTVEEFLALAGLDAATSPLRPVFECFHAAIDECGEELSSIARLEVEKHRVSDATRARVEKALATGVPVRVGKFRSEGSQASSAQAEMFLCCEHFILENEQVFIDLTDSSW